MTNIKQALGILALVTLSACGKGCTGCQDTVNKPAAVVSSPDVLIIGDSISEGYTPHVKSLLAGEKTVERIPENARSTGYTLEKLDSWLALTPSPKVIVWNNGMWNATVGTFNFQNDGRTYGTNPEVYETHLVEIAKRLLATGAKVYFCTTTEIYAASPGLNLGYDDQFNAIARRVLPAMGVEIIELPALSTMHDGPDSIHYTDAGYSIFAGIVVDAIR